MSRAFDVHIHQQLEPDDPLKIGNQKRQVFRNLDKEEIERMGEERYLEMQRYWKEHLERVKESERD